MKLSLCQTLVSHIYARPWLLFLSTNMDRGLQGVSYLLSLLLDPMQPSSLALKWSPHISKIKSNMLVKLRRCLLTLLIILSGQIHRPGVLTTQPLAQQRSASLIPALFGHQNSCMDGWILELRKKRWERTQCVSAVVDAMRTVSIFSNVSTLLCRKPLMIKWWKWRSLFSTEARVTLGVATCATGDFSHHLTADASPGEKWRSVKARAEKWLSQC